MLESFRVSNFRLFQNLEVQRLNRVNLIVGQNNVGKSTFLEAIELYVSNASPAVLLDLVESRQENWFNDAQPHPSNFTGNSVRHLFFGHKLPQVLETGILLEDVASSRMLHIGTAAYQNKKNEEGVISKVRVLGQQLSLFDDELSFDEDLSNVEVFLVVEEQERTRRLFRVDRDIREIRRYSPRVLYEEPELKLTWQLVSTTNMPDQKLAALWDLTSLTELKSEVIEALRLVDDRVSDVGFVEDVSQTNPRHSGGNRIPLVKLAGLAEPLPLKSMGDGMTRLFHIIVALVNAQNGLLLIDEFENGLHWTVQPKVWDIVFLLSARLNVQVFATTHSRDCIRGFDQVWNQYPDSGAFFRLDAKGGLIKAIEYTPETLTDAIEMDVEVR